MPSFIFERMFFSADQHPSPAPLTDRRPGSPVPPGKWLELSAALSSGVEAI
jgi:hypothetical protein